MQQDPQKVIEQLEQTVANLKVRVFDASEAARNTENTLNEYAGAVAQRLGLDEDASKDLNEHIKALEVVVSNQVQVEQTGDPVEASPAE